MADACHLRENKDKMPLTVQPAAASAEGSSTSCVHLREILNMHGRGHLWLSRTNKTKIWNQQGGRDPSVCLWVLTVSWLSHSFQWLMIFGEAGKPLGNGLQMEEWVFEGDNHWGEKHKKLLDPILLSVCFLIHSAIHSNRLILPLRLVHSLPTVHSLPQWMESSETVSQNKDPPPQIVSDRHVVIVTQK